MRIAIITTSYPKFLHELYLNNPGLESKPYLEQLAARNDSLFGFSDFYSRAFTSQGHEAAEFHVNNRWLQQTWAQEHGLGVLPPEPSRQRLPPVSSLRRLLKPLKPLLRPFAGRLMRPRVPPWQVEVLRAQLDAFRPDIIFNQEPATVYGGVLESLRAAGRRLVGQISSALPPGENFATYDLMVSSLPNFIEQFHALGVPAALNRLAFEPAVLDKVGTALPRNIPVSFIGTLSPAHTGRIALLERLAERVPLKMWGSGIEQISPESPLRRCYQGEAWGRAMYQVLGRSKITLNFHGVISGAGPHANNLRLYEATGMGAMLLTDHKDDLGAIFAADKEVVSYRSADDCVSRIDELLADDARRVHIAVAGQRRTLDTHAYNKRAEELLAIFQDVMAGRARARWLPETVTT